MSGVHPYCIVPEAYPPEPGLTGVDEAPVLGYGVGPLTVWVSPLGEAPPLDLGRVRQHHRVVEAATTRVTPVPVRFGGWAPTSEALFERILSRADELEAALAAVSGRVEFGIRFGDPAGSSEPSSGAAGPRSSGPSASPETSSGRAYLRARAREHDERRRRRERGASLVECLRGHLEALSMEERITSVPPPGLVAVAHLVARSDSDRYLELIGSFLRHRTDDCEMHATGPWPPYSFMVP